MSYRVELSFAEVKDSEDVLSFIAKFTKAAKEGAMDIIRDNVAYIPSLRYPLEGKRNLHYLFNEYWLLNLFTFKFIYLKEYGVLACVTPSYIPFKKLFTNYTYFQNSTDQDYPYATWDGIKYFEKIRDEVKAIPFTEKGAVQLYKYRKERGIRNYHSEEEFKKFDQKEFEYYKKETIYSAIFDPIEHKVFRDNEDVIKVAVLATYEDYSILGDFEDYVNRVSKLGVKKA